MNKATGTRICPFDVIAHEKGFSRLAISTDFYPAYASLAIAATQNWVETHSSVLMRYITAIREALIWLYERNTAFIYQGALSPLGRPPRLYFAYQLQIIGL